MTKPIVTIELLTELVNLGFTNEFFDIAHHFEAESINNYITYCEEHTGKFQAGGTNELTQERLSIILNSYVAGGFTNTEVFRFLAHASAKEIPYK